MKREPKTALAAQIYAGLLKLYPRTFREQYGAAMLQAFRDECRETRGRLWGVWVKSLYDLLVNACAERLTQMKTRAWLVWAMNLSASIIAYFASWLVMLITLVVITFVMLVPWDEGRVPTETFAGMVNCFFESDFILLPLFIVTICEIIAISKLTRRRGHRFSSIYWHFTLVNIGVTVVGLATVWASQNIIRLIFPNPPVFEPGYGFNTDVSYGTAVVYTGLIVIGLILAYFVRLAWRTKDSLPLSRERSSMIVMQ